MKQVAVLTLALSLSGCGQSPQEVRRHGDEIMVAGRMFRIGAPVVLWIDPGGYDGYRVEPRFEERAPAQSQPTTAPARRFGVRHERLSDVELARVRGGGWDLPLLQRVVDQVVIHYDATGTSRATFRVLHGQRGLSCHFLLDLDGTIYQTLDLKERAWHATIANFRSIGIEIANVGAVAEGRRERLERWYERDANGKPRIKLPDNADTRLHAAAPLAPIRSEIVRGAIHGRIYEQYDLTPRQYEALIKLTAALCSIFPQVRCDYPRDAQGRLVRGKLPDEALRDYRGLLGHYHIQENKIDPGPAFQWERLVRGARRRMR